MPVTRLLLVSLVLLALAFPARSADLSKIERTIAKEPAYQSKTPKYCLLVFGPEAKRRVWLVLDGKFLYVDHNSNGDLTGAGKRFEGKQSPNGMYVTFRKIQLEPVSTKTKFNVLVQAFTDGRVELDFRSYDDKNALRKQDTQEENLRFADRPQDAPILTFDGDLTFKLAGPKPAFVRGNKASRLVVRVGTPGLGEETFLRYIVETATATIAFPNRNAQDKPIVVEVTLKSPG